MSKEILIFGGRLIANTQHVHCSIEIMSIRPGLLQATKIQREKAAMDIITIITRAGDRATRLVLSRFVFWTFWQFKASGPSQEEEEGKSRRYREVGKLMIYMNVGTICMDKVSLNTVHMDHSINADGHLEKLTLCSLLSAVIKSVFVANWFNAIVPDDVSQTSLGGKSDFHDHLRQRGDVRFSWAEQTLIFFPGATHLPEQNSRILVLLWIWRKLNFSAMQHVNR